MFDWSSMQVSEQSGELHDEQHAHEASKLRLRNAEQEAASAGSREEQLRSELAKVRSQLEATETEQSELRDQVSCLCC